jgi:hypothetical protein
MKRKRIWLNVLTCVWFIALLAFTICFCLVWVHGKHISWTAWILKGLQYGFLSCFVLSCFTFSLLV